MSSSSIEVMSGDDVQMVLMGSDDAGLEERKPQLHTLTAAEPVTYVMSNQDETQEEEQVMEIEEPELDDFDPLGPSAGSIIFSPQDMMSLQRDKKGRGRGNRGRGQGRSTMRRMDALTIKLEEGGDYSRINVPVSCEICGKIVANGKTLVQHMTTHSDIKPFQCPHCPSSFSRMVHLQGHLVLHGIEKQFECPICHQRFSRQDCVKVHMRLHDKSKCVFCDVCHKAFLTLGALNIHMRIHRGEKPFKCHLCGKCFTQKNHVITHIKRHTKVSDTPFSKKLGPRMFQCEHCPRSFIRLSDYERHVQWNHGAVAETNITDKLISLNASSEVESNLNNALSSEFIAPAETLNIKVKKRGFRKVMCTIGTQTDEEGGHVIIPRQYQSSTSMATASTQVSAPPTPRAAEEEIYENDMFDEGMDRNYSSDEEEGEIQEDLEENRRNVTYQECETITVSYSQDGPSTSANDDAFDAVIGKAKPQLMKTEPEEKPELIEPRMASTELEKIKPQPKENDKIQYELGTEYSKRDQAFFETQQAKPVESRKEIVIPPKNNLNASSTDTNYAVETMEVDIRKPTITIGQRPAKIMENFNTKNWKGRARGRGRGRGKIKGIMGLTGATHLRLIRKSMMNFISEKTEVLANKNKENTGQQETADVSGDGRVKRQARSKQHGKDFVCSSKSCETCNPTIEKDPKIIHVEKSAPVTDSETNKQLIEEESSSTTTASVKDQSQKLLQFLISGDESNLQGTDFKLICDVKVHEEAKRQRNDFSIGFKSSDKSKVGNNYSSYSGDISSHLTNQGEKTEYFTTSTTSAGDIISPPVELQAFCIPTYSCKLCGREFRFEGKLHRHIESVHQKKSIFSPDVKPGRGSTKFMDRDSPLTVEPHEDTVVMRKKPTPQNPEIEALRSEWDDDDNDDNDDEYDENEGIVEEVASQPQSIGHIDINRPIVTREIVPVTGTVTDVYVSGVKVNINKLSGLAGSDILDFTRRNQSVTEVTSSHREVGKHQEVRKQQEKVVNTLDVKCRKLLEKLFDHTLLIDCGLFEEHVSVVLGRLLQHYGVKMIEDYGQGQYEVLKYNLWRLIEWKVTMEQMEEFYTEGKSVEEMMDDIMNGRVPIIAHHEPQQVQIQEQSNQPQHNPNEQISSVETVHISENQIMLSQVANVFSGQLNLGDGVTQVVLAQDVSPELLQGAHIVTIDPTTGQVLSQVTADQVILAESMGDELTQQIQQSMDGHIVVSHSSAPSSTVVTSLPPGSILASHGHNGTSVQVSNSHIDTTQVLSGGTGTIVKMEETHSIRPSQ